MNALHPDAIRIGWASRDVTPDCPVNLHGQFRTRISTGVKDPVTVTALALSSGESPADTVVFVSCDTCYIPAPHVVQGGRRTHVGIARDDHAGRNRAPGGDRRR